MKTKCNTVLPCAWLRWLKNVKHNKKVVLFHKSTSNWCTMYINLFPKVCTVHEKVTRGKSLQHMPKCVWVSLCVYLPWVTQCDALCNCWCWANSSQLEESLKLQFSKTKCNTRFMAWNRCRNRWKLHENILKYFSFSWFLIAINTTYYIFAI